MAFPNPKTTRLDPKKESSPYNFQAAYRRIGRTHEDVMEWLIRFCEIDLRSLRQREWNSLRNELWCLTAIGYKELQGFNIHEAIVYLNNIKENKKDDFEDDLLRQNDLTFILVKKLQRITKAALQDLTTEEGATILPEITIGLFIIKNSKPFFGHYSQGMEVFYLVKSQTATHDQFIFLLMNVLKEVGTRLTTCHSPRCRKFFVMHRYEQRYCTKRCRSREAMRELREKRREEKLQQESKEKGGRTDGKKRGKGSRYR